MTETLSQRFEQDFRQALLDDDPGEYKLPVSADGIAELSHKDIERIVRIAAASFENVQEVSEASAEPLNRPNNLTAALSHIASLEARLTGDIVLFPETVEEVEAEELRQLIEAAP